MIWFFAILTVLALGGVAVVASGRGQPMAPAYDDAPDSLVPSDGPVTADDLRRIRFPLAVRGYRMAEVDALLERLAEEREALDATAADVGPPPDAPPAPPETPPASPERRLALPETADDTDPSTSAH
jgi:DivIVA domain-containing protein